MKIRQYIQKRPPTKLSMHGSYRIKNEGDLNPLGFSFYLHGKFPSSLSLLTLTLEISEKPGWRHMERGKGFASCFFSALAVPEHK